MRSHIERGAHGFVCIFDLSRKNTFVSIKKWIQYIKTHSSLEHTILVLGNKKDTEAKEVTAEDIAEF